MVLIKYKQYRRPFLSHLFRISLLLTCSFIRLKAQSRQDSITLIARPWKVVAGGNGSQATKLPPPMQFVIDFRSNGIVEFPTTNPADKTLKWKFQGKSRLLMDDSLFTITVLKPGTFVIVENNTGKKMIMIPAEK